MVYESEGKQYTIAEIDVLNNGKYKLPLVTLEAIDMYNNGKKEVEIIYIRKIEPKLTKISLFGEILEEVVIVKPFHCRNGINSIISYFLESHNIIKVKQPLINEKSDLYAIEYRLVTNKSEDLDLIKDFDNYVRRIVLPNLEEFIHPLYLPDLYSKKEEKRIRSNLEEALKKIKDDFNLWSYILL